MGRTMAFPEEQIYTYTHCTNNSHPVQIIHTFQQSDHMYNINTVYTHREGDSMNVCGRLYHCHTIYRHILVKYTDTCIMQMYR